MPAAELIPFADTAPQKPLSIAPIWHTLLLVFAILGFSAWGTMRSEANGSEPMTTLSGSRLTHYALSAALELAIVAWVAIGLRIRKVSFRSLLGNLPNGLNDITKEVAIAAVFWIVSMAALGSLAATWSIVQNTIYKHHQSSQSTPQTKKEESPRQQQIEMAKKLMTLAPANGTEIAAWAALCLIVGFSEEFVFRGYLQSQGIALLGSVPISVLLSSLVFGAAHGYQGVRGIFLIGAYGAFFSIITLMRRNLLPGMLAHAWHDFATGIALALIRESHMLDKLDKLPISS